MTGDRDRANELTELPANLWRACRRVLLRAIRDNADAEPRAALRASSCDWCHRSRALVAEGLVLGRWEPSASRAWSISAR